MLEKVKTYCVGANNEVFKLNQETCKLEGEVMGLVKLSEQFQEYEKTCNDEMINLAMRADAKSASLIKESP